MKFVFFTKTYWNEPPRLRRQLADLLLKRGHSVHFFEKPRFLFPKTKTVISDKLIIQTHPYLIHHQLRLTSSLRYLNSLYEMAFVKHISKFTGEDTIIVNFNYDAIYLREIFTHNTIITIVNDDFISQAKFNNGSHVRDSLEMTCDSSDTVLAVSFFLVDSIVTKSKVNLFLPWSKTPFQKPDSSASKRNRILIWGYIDQRIDICFLEEVIMKNPDYEFVVAGPIDRKMVKILKNTQLNYTNISVVGVKALSDLPISSILCALVPYRLETRFGASVTMLNKGFPLLSAGLPLIIRGMPNFMLSKSIFDVVDSSCVQRTLQYIVENYDEIQNDISDILSRNTEEQRYREFLSFI